MTPRHSKMALRTLWAFLLLVAFADSALAQPTEVQRYLNAARQLYEDLEYERALEQLARAKSFPHGVDEDVLIALYEGIILADLGRRDESLAAFKTAVLLKPNCQLPIKVSPKVDSDFEAIRADVSKDTFSFPTAPNQSDRPQREPPKPELLPKQTLVAAPPYSPSLGEKLRPHRLTLSLSMVGAGAAAAGVGLYFGSRSNNEVKSANQATSKQDGLSHLQKANTDATVANILFAVAGAVAAGGIATYFLIPSSPPASSSQGSAP